MQKRLWETFSAALILVAGALTVACASPGAPQAVGPGEAPTIEMIRAEALRGDAQYQTHLGGLYAMGRGVPEDPVEAFSWFRMAAEQGHAQAQYNLGIMYALARGVAKDEAQATKWYRLAGEQGVAKAQFQLGVNHYMGRGTPWNLAEAHTWFSRAADNPQAEAAEKDTAARYRDGTQQLMELLEAAEQGHGEAQLAVGRLFAEGKSVRLDRVAAHRWLSLAARSPGEATRSQASSALPALEEQMSGAEIAEARRLAAEWSPPDPTNE